MMDPDNPLAPEIMKCKCRSRMVCEGLRENCPCPSIQLWSHTISPVYAMVNTVCMVKMRNADLHVYMQLPTVRAPVFGRYQFSAPRSIREKPMEVYYLDEWIIKFYTACCWFPTSSNILIFPSQFWQIRFESYWLHCSKCRILVLLLCTCLYMYACQYLQLLHFFFFFLTLVSTHADLHIILII